jgi:hypothetical protein
MQFALGITQLPEPPIIWIAVQNAPATFRLLQPPRGIISSGPKSSDIHHPRLSDRHDQSRDLLK